MNKSPHTGKLEDKFANKPFAPKSLPFFYGWIIVFAGTLSVIMSMPGQTIGISAFKNSIRDAMGLNDISISTSYMIGTIASALILTYAGKLLDIIGARFMAPIAALGLGLITFAFSKCDSIAHLISDILPASIAGYSAMIVLSLLFFFLRLTGQGMLTLTGNNMISKWFNYRRGFATGIAGFFIQPAFSGAAYIFFILITAYGWRTSWLIFGSIAVFIFIPVALLLFRDNPEAAGLIPDGNKVPDSYKTNTIHTITHQFTLKEARKTLAFWIFAGTLMMSGLFITALSFDVENIFAAAGMTRNTAFASFLPGCILSMIARPLLGKLADKIQLKHIIRIQIAGMSSLIIGTAFLAPGPILWMYLIGMGINSACFGLILTVTWPNFYGREHLGAISGHVMSLIVFSSAIGPWFFNKLKAVTGNYSNASMVCLSIISIIFILTFFVKHPQQKLQK
jgi:MFS family permease